ncbi:hypothetical protein [Embleya sp. MST-111070]|uniref:hypothetical protein n=1 Tax=Embleya sp. MST-111070 TaxID=3398231 RepID=UPI003F73D9AB
MTDRREGDELVPNRRGTELAMLGFAVLATLSAFANVALAGGGSLSTDAAAYGFRIARAALCDEAWPRLRAALRLWRPVCEDHIAPISLLADPVLAELITPARGREILAMPRGVG